MNSSEKFRKTVKNNIKFKLFMLKQLPSAFFSGIKLVEITEEKAVVTIPYKCKDGTKIKNAVEENIKTGEGVTIETKSTGKDKVGDVVSEFYFTWTFNLHYS